MEEWRPIEGFEGYEVSNFGRVRSFKNGSAFLRKICAPSNNYASVCLYRNGKCKSVVVHRLVAKAFVPNPNNKPLVNHIDGNKANNCADNLEWVTHEENVKHAIFMGLRQAKDLSTGKVITTNAESDVEEWRDIEGYGGHYQISNLGNVRNFYFKDKRPYLKPKISQKGYLRVGIRFHNKQVFYLIHRLVAQAFIPNPENKPLVNHIDGDKTNNRVNNLEWVTPSENIQHAWNKGFANSHRGGRNSILTAEDVKHIREHYIPRDKVFGGRALAREFGVNVNTISLIVLGKTYKNT